jgi:hypothetical protein
MRMMGKSASLQIAWVDYRPDRRTALLPASASRIGHLNASEIRMALTYGSNYSGFLHALIRWSQRFRALYEHTARTGMSSGVALP